MSEINKVVNEEELTDSPVSEDDKTQMQGQEEKGQEPEKNPTTQPGDKTDSALLLEALQEERRRRKELEERLEAANRPEDSEDEVFSDEGKVLKRRIDSIESQIRTKAEQESLNAIYVKHPILKEKESEFNAYRSEYPLVGMESIAKLFLSENGLFDSKRKGFEKPTGGNKTPAPSGMSADDAATIRKNNPKKYREMLKKGQIKITD